MASSVGALDARPAVGGADRHRGHLLQGDPVGREAGLRQDVARSGHADEVGELEQLVGVLPRQDLGQRVGAGDEEQLGIGPFAVQVAQRVDRVGRTSALELATFQHEAAHVLEQECGTFPERLAGQLQEDVFEIRLPKAIFNRLRGAFRNDPTAGKKDDAVGHLFHLPHVVGGVEHG